VKGLGLRESFAPVAKMLLATLVMGAACSALRASPAYPTGAGRSVWLGQLLQLTGCGAAVYFVACHLMGLNMLQALRPKRKRA
jgi:hypothetical protein